MKIPGLHPSEQTLTAPPITIPATTAPISPRAGAFAVPCILPGSLNGSRFNAPRPTTMATIPAKIFQFWPSALCATCPISPATLPRMSRAMIVPTMKEQAPSRTDRRSADSRIPA